MSPSPSLNGVYYGPNESSTDIFLERGFIVGGFLGGVGYGIQFTLYLSCAIFLWTERRARSTRSLFLLGYITLLIVIATFFAGVQCRTTQETYIDNRNYPGGPWQYFLSTEYLPINVMFYASFIAGTFLADLLMLWRCWIILSASGRARAYTIVAFPACMILASLVMGIIWAVESTKPGLSLYNTLPLKYGTAYYVLSVSANVLLTIIITVQLLIFRRRIMRFQSPEHGTEYFSLLTIMVESAALYSGFGIIFIVTYALNNPLNQIFLFVANSSQQIASYLIIYRVAQGSAWGRRTFARQEKIQSQGLRFRQRSSMGSFRERTSATATEHMLPDDTQPPGLTLLQLQDPDRSSFGAVADSDNVIEKRQENDD